MEKFPNFEITKFFDDMDIPWRKQRSNDHDEITVNCPSCIDRGEARADTKMRFWFNPEKGLGHCYNCFWDVPTIRVVMKLAGVGERGALRMMRGKINPLEHLNYRLVHDDEKAIDEDEDEEVPEVTFPHGFEPFDECKKPTIFHLYLKRRGIPLDYAKTMGWGFSHIGYTKNRLIVPIYMDDRLVFWQARDVLEGGGLTGKRHEHWGSKDLYRKVLNPSGASARRVVYGYDTVKESREIVIVEGFTDAAKVGYGGVAINGKKLHAAQLSALTRLPKLKSIVLMLDPDAFTDQRYHKGGKLKAPSSVEAAKGLLQVYFPVRTIELPTGRDAGSYESDELAEIVWAKAFRQASENTISSESSAP